CGSNPTKRNEMAANTKKNLAESVEENSSFQREKTEPKPKPKRQVIPKLSNLRQFISYYQRTLESLGKKKDDSSYMVEPEEVELMKQQLSHLIQVDPSSISFLVNSRNQGAWFGNCTLFLDKKEEKIYIVSREGEEQILSLRDKIFGGLYKTDRGEWVFISAFYGDLQKKVPYRVFWGASELKVTNFMIDRSKDGTVDGQAKTAAGDLLTLFRKGRDNKTVRVNNQTLLAVFE
ncbi:MAG: hypothetical protein ACKOA8_12930, partial [Deltaproteobacteria bacterium]